MSSAVSSVEEKTEFDTDSADSIAQNDDILLEIGIGETNH
jgi:hypothetical protein